LSQPLDQGATHLFRPSGVAVNLDQCIFVDKADLTWCDADNWAVLVVQVQDVLMPPAERVSPRSPELCEASCRRSGYVTQRVETEPMDDLGEDNVNEDESGAFPSDVFHERGQPRAYRAAAVNVFRV
jgi:hypothetical protein